MKKRLDTRAPVTLAKTSPVLEHEEIVIGSNLAAVLYAFTHNLPIFFSRPRRPFRFDYFDADIDFSCLGTPTESRQLQLHDGAHMTVGASKNLIWERLLFILSLAGKAPLSTLCSHLRYDGEVLRCSNDYAKIAEIKFEKAHYFGDANATGIVQKEVANDRYLCYDWIAFNRGGKHEVDYIETEDDFVKQIWFYPSDRIDGNTAVKDACVISHLNAEHLDEFDYSHTMARFKLIHEMESRGMKGLYNGLSPNGIPKYYKFRTTHLHRERSPQSYNASAPSPKITIATKSEEDLIEKLSASVDNYRRILEHL